VGVASGRGASTLKGLLAVVAVAQHIIALRSSNFSAATRHKCTRGPGLPKTQMHERVRGAWVCCRRTGGRSFGTWTWSTMTNWCSPPEFCPWLLPAQRAVHASC